MLKLLQDIKKLPSRLLSFGVVCFFFLSLPSLADQKNVEPSHKKVVRILSIDGGGIRGIIPALLLEHIESRLLPGLRLADCFDVIAGTSTGGLIALMLVKPDLKGRPHYAASEITSIYEKFGKDVFSQSLWQWIKSGNGWWDAKYSSEALESYLKTYLGETRLKECIANVIVPAYEIELDKTFFFDSTRAKAEPRKDCFIKDLARATSAAPTYFRPATLVDGTGMRELTLVDGGLGVNNPTLAAAVYASKIFGQGVDFFIVSLGTGTNYGAQTRNVSREKVQTSGLLGWAHKIIDVMMCAVNNITHHEMGYVFNYGGGSKRYFRLQPILEAEQEKMDNAEPENIQILKQHAQNLINQHQEEIGEIVKTLNTPTEKNQELFKNSF